MTSTPISDRIEAIIGHARGDVDLMTDDDLEAAYGVYKAAYDNNFSLLVVRLGDAQRARVELSRALELPVSVLQRRATQTYEHVMANRLPSAAELAAQVAVILRNMYGIVVVLQRRRTATVN